MPKRHQNFVFFLQLICSIDCKLNLLSNYVIYSHFLWTQHLHFGIFSTNFTHIRWFGHIWKMNLVFLLYNHYAPFIFQAQILSLITNKSLIKYFNSKVMHSIIIISSHINTSLKQFDWHGPNKKSLSAKKAPKFRFFFTKNMLNRLEIAFTIQKCHLFTLLMTTTSSFWHIKHNCNTYQIIWTYLKHEYGIFFILPLHSFYI